MRFYKVLLLCRARSRHLWQWLRFFITQTVIPLLLLSTNPTHSTQNRKHIKLYNIIHNVISVFSIRILCLCPKHVPIGWSHDELIIFRRACLAFCIEPRSGFLLRKKTNSCCCPAHNPLTHSLLTWIKMCRRWIHDFLQTFFSFCSCIIMTKKLNQRFKLNQN